MSFFSLLDSARHLADNTEGFNKEHTSLTARLIKETHTRLYTQMKKCLYTWCSLSVSLPFESVILLCILCIEFCLHNNHCILWVARFSIILVIVSVFSAALLSSPSLHTIEKPEWRRESFLSTLLAVVVTCSVHMFYVFVQVLLDDIKMHFCYSFSNTGTHLCFLLLLFFTCIEQLKWKNPLKLFAM